MKYGLTPESSSQNIIGAPQWCDVIRNPTNRWDGGFHCNNCRCHQWRKKLALWQLIVSESLVPSVAILFTLWKHARSESPVPQMTANFTLWQLAIVSLLLTLCAFLIFCASRADRIPMASVSRLPLTSLGTCWLQKTSLTESALRSSSRWKVVKVSWRPHTRHLKQPLWYTAPTSTLSTG